MSLPRCKWSLSTNIAAGNKLKRRIEELEQKNGAIIRHSSESNSVACQELYLQGSNAVISDTPRRNNSGSNKIVNGHTQEVALVANSFGSRTPPCEDDGFVLSQREYLMQLPASTVSSMDNPCFAPEHGIVHSQHETPSGTSIMSPPLQGNFDSMMQKNHSLAQPYTWALDNDYFFQFSSNASSSTSGTEVSPPELKSSLPSQNGSNLVRSSGLLSQTPHWIHLNAKFNVPDLVIGNPRLHSRIKSLPTNLQMAEPLYIWPSKMII